MGNAKWGFLTMKQPQGGLKTMAHSTMQEGATDRKPGLPDKNGTRAARLHGIPSHASPHKAEPARADALQTQHAAPGIAARCIAQRNALHQPSHRTAFPVPQQHLLPGKRQVQPQLPSPARLGQTSKRPLTTTGDPLQHGTLTRVIAPAASTSLPLLSPAVSQPYKIRCAE